MKRVLSLLLLLAPLTSVTPAAAHRPRPVYAPRAHLPFGVGEPVDVLWGASWWDARVLAVRGDLLYITYVGWSAMWDEWVPLARVRESFRHATPFVPDAWPSQGVRPRPLYGRPEPAAVAVRPHAHDDRPARPPQPSDDRPARPPQPHDDRPARPPQSHDGPSDTPGGNPVQPTPGGQAHPGGGTRPAR